MIGQADHHLMPVKVKDGFAGGNAGWKELLGFQLDAPLFAEFIFQKAAQMFGEHVAQASLHLQGEVNSLRLKSLKNHTSEKPTPISGSRFTSCEKSAPD